MKYRKTAIRWEQEDDGIERRIHAIGTKLGNALQGKQTAPNGNSETRIYSIKFGRVEANPLTRQKKSSDTWEFFLGHIEKK